MKRFFIFLALIALVGGCAGPERFETTSGGQENFYAFQGGTGFNDPANPNHFYTY